MIKLQKTVTSNSLADSLADIDDANCHSQCKELKVTSNQQPPKTEALSPIALEELNPAHNGESELGSKFFPIEL